MNATFIQLELKVSRKEYLTPHYIRVWLTGEGVEALAETTVGEHNKILIPPGGVDKIHFPAFDTEQRRWMPPAEEVRPVVRTYTHRGIDLTQKEIWIDFAVHGEDGPASRWAMHAQKGAVLGLMMKAAKKELFPVTDNYLLVGDATGMPVLGAILERLPAGARGQCIIEVHSKEDVQVLPTKAAIDFHWLYHTTPWEDSPLPAFVKSLPLPAQNRYAHIAAEFSAVKGLRQYLREGQKWQREELDAYAYWKAGVSEDASAGERRSSRTNQ